MLSLDVQATLPISKVVSSHFMKETHFSLYLHRNSGSHSPEFLNIDEGWNADQIVIQKLFSPGSGPAHNVLNYSLSHEISFAFLVS